MTFDAHVRAWRHRLQDRLFLAMWNDGYLGAR